MSTDREIALDYLRTPPGAPWRWEDGGRALVWKDGATIAFREELGLIFERLTPGRLPPFPTLVCVLAACRGRYLEFPVPAKGATDTQAARLAMGAALAKRAEQVAGEQLRKLAALPADVISKPRGKALLAQIVFEAVAERGGGSEAARVAAGLRCGLAERELNATPADAPPLDVAGTIHRAAQPLRGHTAETLRLRLGTGLDVLPGKGPDLVLPRGERARRLLAKLSEDEEQRGLALVVRDLMAAIRLPGVLARADEEAAGGAAGLGNRGTLDRLLLSELAHDDLTLATRVALNEALYLHREPPARRPRRGLAVLLDAGLRMWGVPRVLGAATGLALLAGWSDEAAAGAWRADDERATEVDLLDEKALAEHLGALGLALNPGRALPGFLARAAEGGETDVVVVTHRDALRTEAFRRQLARVELERGFLVLIDADGLVRLHALPWGGDGVRPLAEVRAGVAKLFATGKEGGAKAPAGPPPIDPVAGLDLPAIFRVSPFPLLLPVTGKLERTVAWGPGGLCVTADRRLLMWGQVGCGARQMLADLPSGRTYLLEADETDEQGGITLVRGRAGQNEAGRISVLHLPSGTREPTITRVDAALVLQAAVRARAVIFLVMPRRIAVVARDASALLHECLLPLNLEWISGHYFARGDELVFAAWNGASVEWITADMGRHVPAKQILCAFQREGAGPWALTRDGRIVSPGGAEIMRLDFVAGSAVVLREGNELLVGTTVGGRRDMVDQRHHVTLATKSSRPLAANRVTPDAVTFLDVPTRQQLQSRFEAIHVAPGHPVRLRKTRGKWLEIFSDSRGLRLVAAGEKAVTLNAGACPFVSMTTSASLGCQIQRARWPGGSVAWLDSRGLLHLRSHDPAVPELTLTLGASSPLAAWTSEGRLVGPLFFTGRIDNGEMDVAWRVLDKFSNALC